MQKANKPSTAITRGGGAVVPASKWRSAGDAIVAAQRLRKEETTIYRPEERRVTLAADKLVTAQRQQSAAEQRQLAKAGQASHKAAKVGDANGLARLVQAEPSAANWEDENGVTPLLFAAAYGRLPCAEVLCGAGADVNKKNVWGSTPLINAAHNAHVGVVQYLILHEASVSVRDKDGTPLDGALRRMCRMVRGVSGATDDKHPDKPALEAASSSLNLLNQQTNRGPLWHKQLEAAFAPLRPLLAQSDAAEVTLALGKANALGAGYAAPRADKEGERPGSAASSKSKSSVQGDGKKKKKDDGPPPPDEGRAALYDGLAAYLRCIEMLREPAIVRKDERLRVGGTSDADGKGSEDGLTQKVGRIKTALALDASLSLPSALKQANVAMGFEETGSLPEQTARLVRALGLQ